MKKILITLTSICVLSACGMSRQEQLNLELSKFVNMPEANLLVKYGKPDVVTQINENTKMYSYHSKEFNSYMYDDMTDSFRKSQFSTNEDYNRYRVTPEGAIKVLQYYSVATNPTISNDDYMYKKCIKNFTVSNGIVTNFGFNGNGC